MKESLLICLFSIFFLATQAQDSDYVDTLRSKFDDYRTHNLTEKLYAHIDQDIHLTGETLWFSIYAVDGSFHKPLSMSSVAYAEIVDAAGTPVIQGKIGLTDGHGSGSFFLPASLATGNYRFRVYTNWMKNFSPEYYYSRIITIVNPFLSPDKAPVKTATSCRIEFFPEGGNLLSGVESKVAFRISEPSGRTGLCGGEIQNEKGESVAVLTPDKSGLGYFIFTPYAEHKYRAVIKETSGKQHFYPLPEAVSSGYAMQLRDSGDYVAITVNTKSVPDEHLYLFAHARQIIAHAGMQQLRDNETVFLLEKKDLREGVSHITVFNEKLQPVCERLYFKPQKNQLNIQINTSQKTFRPRKKVSVSINTREGDDLPAGARMSMAVYRIDSLSSMPYENIHSYLWLASDLPGCLESLAYMQAGEEGYSAIDNLLLTHGWRRFDWKDVLSKQTDKQFLPEVREHIVSVRISKGQQPQRRVLTYLGSPGKIIRAYGAWTNADGVARFEIKDFYGPRRIIVQTNADSTERYDITIQDPFSKDHVTMSIPPFTIRKEISDALNMRSIAMQVQDIYYYESHGTRMDSPAVDSAAFYGMADATYFLDDYTRFPLMEEVMREYVAGVFVRKRRDGFHFVVADQAVRGILSGDPMVLLDGVPVPDVDNIMRIDPLRIKKLEVVKRPYYLGQAVFSGIVSYTSYNGDLAGLKLDPHSISLDYDGLQLKRIFHKPQYTNGQTDDRLPDQRFLLHWEPDITTDDEKGSQAIEFHTSDVPGRYLIVVEGISNTGLSGAATQVFTVEPGGSP